MIDSIYPVCKKENISDSSRKGYSCPVVEKIVITQIWIQ